VLVPLHKPVLVVLPQVTSKTITTHKREKKTQTTLALMTQANGKDNQQEIPGSDVIPAKLNSNI
jgi:hypothetical protein